MICKSIHSAFNECQITFFFITNCSPNHQGATTRLAFAEIFFFGSQIVPIISKTIRTIKVGLFLVGKNDFAPLMVTLQMFISKIASGFDVRFCQLRLALHFFVFKPFGIVPNLLNVSHTDSQLIFRLQLSCKLQTIGCTSDKSTFLSFRDSWTTTAGDFFAIFDARAVR